MTTTTPQDLLAAVARGIAEGASADDRSAGRQACILLAAALGEPGQSMGPSSPPPMSGVDTGQLVDLAIGKMRGFLAELEAKDAAASAAASSTAAAATEAAAPPPPRTPSSSSPGNVRPRPPRLSIPIVGGHARRR